MAVSRTSKAAPRAAQGVAQDEQPDHDGHYSVYWPRTPRQVEVRPLAKRLGTLEGKTIAFLWDYLFRGDEIFPILQRLLAARFPAMKFIGYEVFGSTHGEDEQAVLRLVQIEIQAALQRLREHTGQLDAGAVLVQAYTGVVYRGPGFAGEACAALVARR